nr:reverse transcriptase domain-containing protein [Tanacetum cinerariifolium]
MMASFFQINTASTSGSGPLPSNTIANPKGKLKAITTRSGLVLDGPSIPMPPPFINPEEDERVDETFMDPDLAEYTIKVPPPLVQKAKPSSQRNYVVHQRDPRHPHIPYPLRMNQEKQQEKDEIHIHKFWQMFKQLHINITLADALILIPKYQKMLKALLSNKEKLLELENTPLNKICLAVILKKLPEKLRDPRKFLIPCGFTKLKCKALADLGASINLMPLSIWKKLGLPELISIRITLELANRAICTPAGIARDVFVLVGKFAFPADFVIVDYESDPRVPLILGRPFLRTARALIDVLGEEMILRDGDDRLTLNMRHDTSSYSSQPHKESINMINIYNDSYEYYLEDLFATNHLSSNPTFSSHTDLTSLEVINPLSGNPTSSPDHLLEEFADELALITFPPRNDDLPFDIESDLREIEYLVNHDPTKEMDSILEDSVDECNHANPNNDLVDTIPEMFTDEHAQSKLLIAELGPPRSSDFLPSPEYDSFLFEDFSEVDALPSTDNEDKDFNPPLHELPFHKEVPGSKTLLSFSSKNEEKVFNPGIVTSKGVHTYLLSKLSHRGPKAFKVIIIFETPMKIFPCSYGEDICILDVPCLHFYPL